MESQTTQKPKARTLEDILTELSSTDQVVFEPIELEAHQDAQALPLPTFTAISYPFDYFYCGLRERLSRQTSPNIGRNLLHLPSSRFRPIQLERIHNTIRAAYINTSPSSTV